MTDKKDNYKTLNLAKINWFDQSKGFGVVSDIVSHYQFFVHYRQCKLPDYSKLGEGEYVFIGEGHDSKRNKDIVTRISIIDSFDKWVYIKGLWQNSSSGKEDYRTILCYIARKAIRGSLKEQFHNGFVQILLNSDILSVFKDTYSIIYDSLRAESAISTYSLSKDLEAIDIAIIDNKTIEYADIIKDYHPFSLYLKLLYSYKYHKDFQRIIEFNFNVKGLPSFMSELKRFICDVNPSSASSLSENPSSMLDKAVYNTLNGRELLEQLNATILSDDKKEQDVYLIQHGWLPQENIAFVIDKYNLTAPDIDNLIRSQYCSDSVKSILFERKVDLFFGAEGFKVQNYSISLVKQSDTINNIAPDWLKTFLKRIQECDSLAAHALEIDLYKKNIIKDIDIDFIIYYINEFSLEDVSSIFDNHTIEREDKLRLFNILYEKTDIQNNRIKELLTLAQKELGESYETWYNQKATTLTEEQKYNWWKAGLFDSFPASYFEDSILNDNESSYKILNDYLQTGMISISDAINLLFNGLDKYQSISNRYEFYKVFYHIKALLSIDTKSQERILAYDNSFFKVCLWFNQAIEEFDFSVLASKFIYFNPEDQVKIIKRLFCLADAGKITLNVEMLESLARVDSDLFAIIAREHPCIPIDISTEVIIKALSSIKVSGNFSTDKEVLETLFKASHYISKYIKISEYFDKCSGRVTLQRTSDDTTLGKIKREGNLFLVELYTSITVNAYSNYYGLYERQQRNSRFEEMLQAIKNIEGRRWNSTKKVWEVPVVSENRLYEFARNNSVEIEGDANYHLKNFKENNEGCPYGIEYCEGRPAPNKDNYTNRDFLWCRNGRCFHSPISMHSPENYENYTLLDFCRILGINTDSTDSQHRVVKYGKYLAFSSLINRANNILEHLYCRECGQMLLPTGLSNYQTHLVTNFHCNNKKCSQYEQDIYISKCFNWKCNGIIDKRDSRSCPNSWVICPQCGSCCSNRTVGQRIEHLKELNLPVPISLYDFIRLKAGHLEKREFYCSECGVQMKRLEYDRFFCPNCRKVLERKPYDFADNYVDQQQNTHRT